MGSTSLANNFMCQVQKICHSSCQTCSILGDPNSCTACSSSLPSGLTYLTFSGYGSCVPDTSNVNYPNMALLQSVSSVTQLGASYLKNITFNGVNYATFNAYLGSSLLYTQNTILFQTLTSPTVTLSFSGIGYNHYNAYVRLSVLSTCSGANDSLVLTIGGVVKTFTVVSSQTILQSNLINHTLNSIQIII